MSFNSVSNSLRRFLDESGVVDNVVIEIRPKQQRDYSNICSTIKESLVNGDAQSFVQIEGEAQYSHNGVTYRIIDRALLSAL